MATTEPAATEAPPAEQARATTRSRWGLALVAVGAAAALGVTAGWVTRAGESRPEQVSFWGPITGQVSERFIPESVEEVSEAADAIVLAHVTGITEGRVLVPESDPTPAIVNFGGIRTVFVLLSVDKAVSGPLAPGQTVKLEMFAPPLPLTAATMRARIPSGPLLFFLWNNASIGQRNGVTNPVVEAREREFWVPASTRGVIGAGPDGLYQALHPHDEPSAYLTSFGATTLEQAAARAAEALG